MNRCNFHLYRNGRGSCIQRTAKNIRKTQDVVHLVVKITAPGGHDGVIAHGFDFVGQNFRRRIGQRKNQWLCSHAFDHIGFEHSARRKAQKHIGARDDFTQCASVGFLCKENFVFVHQLGATFVDHARQVGDVNVFTRNAQFDQQT